MNSDFILHQATYEWTVKAFNRIRKHLSLNIKLHGDSHLLTEGEIFVFNHFARIETFLPHYLIYQKTGAFCRSIGSKSLFSGNDAFARYLIKVGVIPNDYEELLPLLVTDIIAGRKVIIFPEGGMVKDRRVMDKHGKFRIYSREAKVKRKHHSGAAVLAYAVNTVKQAILCAEKEKNWICIDYWLELLGLDDRDQLLFSAHKPTTIIPCNITFYPICNDENILSKQASFINNDLSKQVKEELIIESNLLLENTDMDMRLGSPIYLSENQSWWEKTAQLVLSKNLQSIDHLFTLEGLTKPWGKIIQKTFYKSSGKIRDQYMSEIYQGTTINLLHLASSILLKLYENKYYELELRQYYLCVYLSIKNIQLQCSVNLHRDLLNPVKYSGLVIEEKPLLESFLLSAEKNDLIKMSGGTLYLQQKLRDEYDRSTVRIKNIIQVYANEMAPIRAAVNSVEYACSEIESNHDKCLSFHLHDDELRNYRWHHQYYNRPRFDEVNQKESATSCGQPFLLLPKKGKPSRQRDSSKKEPIGIVLVHGFLASPAEMQPIATKLNAAGYPVYAVRLAGHGTSPADLRGQSWQDWITSLSVGCKILKPYVEKIVLLGFSTGGLISLFYASEQPEEIFAVIAINTPVKFIDKKMHLVPLIHRVDKMLSTVSNFHRAIQYRSNESEHPDINYHSIPIKGLYELLRLKNELQTRLQFIGIHCLLMQSSRDPIITPNSVNILSNGLINAEVTIKIIEADRHGILYESTGNTHSAILDYVKKLSLLSEIRNNRVEEENINV